MTGVEAFFDAVRRGDLPSIRAWLAKDDALVNARAKNGLSPVATALLFGRDDVVNELLGHRPRLTVHEAATVGDLERVRTLVEGDRRLANDRSSPDGSAPLALAAQYGHLDVVRYLLGMGADVNASVPGMEFTALTGAVAGGHAEVVRLLVDAGADVNHAYEENQFTPLITAASDGNLTIVKILVDAGADVRARTAEGKTALAVALEWENTEIVEYLRGRNAP